MNDEELKLEIIDKDNTNKLGYNNIESLSRLLAYSQPERIEDFRKFWKDWFDDIIPGEKFTVIMEALKGRGTIKEIVGVVRFWKSPYCNNKWLIEGLEVMESKRRLGIGSKLVTKGINKLKHMEESAIYVHIKRGNFKSINLHVNLGFKEISKGCNNSFGNYNESINEYKLKLE